MEIIDKKDYKKINKTRRSRGYSFEYDLVKAFNVTDGWAARRLGGSSTGLPDVVATNKEKSILYAIECKSGLSNILSVPADQVQRCRDITDKFLTAYEKRYVVFAFKFPKVVIKENEIKYTARKLQYRFIICTHFRLPPNFRVLAYNITKDTLVYSYDVYIDTLDYIPQSIPEFVNFL